MKKISLLSILFVFGLLYVCAQGPNDTGAYYATAHGKSGQALKTAMFNIIKITKTPGYDALIDAYRKTDTRPDGFVRDWYSNATSYVHDRDKAGSYSAEGDCYNREHLVPQSWFSKGSPMRADAHHVVPTDGYVNNRRSSYPLGEVTTNPQDIEYQSANGYSKLGSAKAGLGYSGKVFEPNDEVKGDIARAYFYMATCYEDKISNWNSGLADYVFSGNRYPGLTQWVIDMMIRWSRLDPVDDVERARNDSVQSWQDNRNPFIDYPGLEDYIWGDKKDVAFDYTQGGGSQTTVAPPVITPNGGTFTEAPTVTLTTVTDSAEIYYTIDGSVPTQTAGKLYNNPFTVSQSLTLKAVAVKGGTVSNISTAVFVISDTTDHPREGVFEKITSEEEFESGKDYLLVYETSSSAGRVYNGCDSGTGRGQSSEVTITNGRVDLGLNQEDAAPVTIEQMSGYVTLYDTKQSVYLSLNSRSNALNVATDATTDNARWTLSFSSGAVLLKNKAYSDYAIYYNSNANIFRCYSSAQKYISLYKATATTPTAIRTINGDNDTAAADTSWYTLSGQRLTSRPVQAGVYIHAGRKVVVK